MATAGRRAVNLVLFAVGAALLWRTFAADSQKYTHQVIIATLLGTGMLLSVIGILRRTLNLRMWLRCLALAVLGAVLVTDLASWYVLAEHVLPDVPRDEIALRNHLQSACAGYLRLAIGLAYVAMTVIALPSRAGPPKQ